MAIPCGRDPDRASLRVNTLILTVGLPRSGKSTWAMQHGAPVVNPDSIRLVLHGQAFYADCEPMVWGIAHTMVKALFLAGHETVILDATNLTEHRRNEWRSWSWSVRYKVFKTSKDLCIERATASGKSYLIDVITRMARHIQWPAVEEDYL